MKFKISIILISCVCFNFFTSQDLMAQKNRKGNEAAIVSAGVIGGLIADLCTSNLLRNGKVFYI